VSFRSSIQGLLHAAIAGALIVPGAALTQEAADTIYAGGPILTMRDAAPRAEAVAVKDGKILAVGTAAEVESHRGPETKTFDLAGRTMLPGLFDAHGHMLMGGPSGAFGQPAFAAGRRGEGHCEPSGVAEGLGCEEC
jgi:imidazolonepropionase-like amidohydrolase